MDIDPQRLAESELVARKIVASLGVKAKVETYTDQRRALDKADFVIVAFQIGGYEPATGGRFRGAQALRPAPDHRRHLGVGGIMRGSATVPHLWKICADMMECARRPSCCNMSTRWRSTPGRSREISGDPPGRALPFGAGHGVGTGARSRHSGRGNPLPRRRHQPHCLLSQFRAPAEGRELARPLSGLAAGLSRGALSPSPATGTRAAPTRCATRC